MPDDELFEAVMSAVKRNKDELLEQLRQSKEFSAKVNKNLGMEVNEKLYQVIIDYLENNKQMVLNHVRKISDDEDE